MDKSWIKIHDRTNPVFLEGLKNFVEYLKNYLDNQGKTKCPCKKCCNCNSYKPATVYAHIHDYGFQQFYTTWVYHGESYASTSASRKLSLSHKRKTPAAPEINNEMFDVIEDVMAEGDTHEERPEENGTGLDPEYDALFEELNAELYLGCTEYDANRYAGRKHKLGAHFGLHGGGDSPDRAKKNPPKGYDVEKWKSLIDGLFNTPEWLRRSAANSQNRKKVPFMPLCGTESYPQKRYVKTEEAPNAIMVWYVAHYRAYWEGRGFDEFENAEALRTWNAICDERDRQHEEVGPDGYVDQLDVLRRTLGETRVYIRGIERKRSSSSPGLSISSSLQRSQLQQQTELIEQLQKQQAEADARVEARLEEQRKQFEKQMKKQRKKQEKVFKKQIKKMMKEMKNQHPGSTSGRDPQCDSDD